MSSAAVMPPKRAARRQQLVENLRDPIVVLEDAHQLQEWAEGAYRQFRPINAWQDWLVQQIALTTFRVNRIQRVERRLRDLESLRAIDCWEEDRRVEAEELAARHFAKEPEHTVCRLLCTPAGCDWLIARWEMLAQSDPAAWTDAQRSLATHLNRGRAADWSAGLIAGRVEGLREHKARLADGDALARTLAESDLSEDLGPALRRVRRREKELLSRLKWFIREAQAQPGDRWLDERYRPDYAPIRVEPTWDASAVAETAPAEAANLEGADLDVSQEVADECASMDLAGDQGETGNDQTNRPAAVPMTPAERAEHRRRRVDPAREVARARRGRRRTA